MATNTTTQQSQEELQKQQQQMQQQQMYYQKMMMLQMAGQLLNSVDKGSVLNALSRSLGPVLSCPNQMVAMPLTQKIKELLAAPESDGIIYKAQQDLIQAMSLTNYVRSQMMYSQGGMNQMGFGMGMNPMMGMNNFGMGMNPMMGMGFGMNQFGFQQPQQNTQTTDGTVSDDQKIKIAHDYINNCIYQADPLIYLIALINSGIDIDFTGDKNFEFCVTQALQQAIIYLSNTNPTQFRGVVMILQSLYQTEYFQKQQKNGGNGQQNQFNQFGMGMNPMMGGFGMGMNNFGMGGFGMNPMMTGMMSGMDMNGGMNMGMNNMFNPMMGMMQPGMNMMGGMYGGVQQMPGMNGSNGATPNNGCYW